MALIDINRDPTNRQLRQFGVISLFVLPLIAWLWGADRTTIGWLAVIGAVIAIVGWVWPKVIKPLFVGLTLLTAPIGIVVGEIALVLIYFGVFLPIGIVFRLLRRDALQLKRDPNTTTYWRPKSAPKDAASYYRQS
ncbi:MAG: hypothetical protein KDA93_08040 [Planctomycetaceae bacterium]|nr:hypothetical protein [Planctomycetaceae bacterium]